MTKILKREEIDKVKITEVANALRKGKLAIFPTDTVYGIGTNAWDELACNEVYEVKNREKNKPLIVLISNISMLKEMVNDISPLEKELINTFWPGDLTIKFKKKKDVLPDIISAKDEYVRIRLLDKGITHKLIETAKVPIVAPSANLSGGKTGTKIKDIVNEFNGKVDYILDYGDIESSICSTVIQVENEEIIVFREGKIKNEQLEKIASIKKFNC